MDETDPNALHTYGEFGIPASYQVRPAVGGVFSAWVYAQEHDDENAPFPVPDENFSTQLRSAHEGDIVATSDKWNETSEDQAHHTVTAGTNLLNGINYLETELVPFGVLAHRESQKEQGEGAMMNYTSRGEVPAFNYTSKPWPVGTRVIADVPYLDPSITAYSKLRIPFIWRPMHEFRNLWLSPYMIANYSDIPNARIRNKLFLMTDLVAAANAIENCMRTGTAIPVKDFQDFLDGRDELARLIESGLTATVQVVTPAHCFGRVLLR